MSYDQENLDQEIQTNWGLTPDDEQAVLDFIQQTVNSDGSTTTEVFDDGSSGDVTIPSETEVAILADGGTFNAAPDSSLLVHVDTDEDVSITVDISTGGAAGIVSGGSGGDDVIAVSDGSSSGLVALASIGDPGTSFVLAGFGDDTVEGASGDDSLDGEAGDDAISGGAGDDTLAGGAGEDTLDGGDGFDISEMEGGRDDFAVTVEGGSLLLTASASGETDRMTRVEFVSFEDGTTVLALDTASEAAVAALFEVVFNREADAEGLRVALQLADPTAPITSVVALAEQFLSSSENTALTDDLSDQEFVEALYQQAYDRDGDAGGVAFWTGVLSSESINRAELTTAFALAREAEDTYDYINVIPDDDIT